MARVGEFLAMAVLAAVAYYVGFQSGWKAHEYKVARVIYYEARTK